jgi:hypothetical protein
MKHVACALALALCAITALAQTEDVAPAIAPVTAPPAPLEAAPTQVLVEGRRPGPGVWKVSRGDHVMWVFGVYSPLPKNMEWDDARVVRLVRNSQEVLLAPTVSVGVSGIGGFFKGLAALPDLVGVQKIPDGATLRDVLPADVYARWSLLKTKYLGNDRGVDRLRPIFAADRLMAAALEQNALAGNNLIYKRITDVAREEQVKVTSTGVSRTVADPGRLLRDFKGSQLDDLACFTKTLDSLEGDIAAIRARANAWANGNVAEIDKLDFADRGTACSGALTNSAAVRKMPGFENLGELARRDWFDAVDRALAANTQTFAVLQMKSVLGAGGVLAALRAKGYTVESPK